MFQELIKSVLRLWKTLPLNSLKKSKKYEAITLGSLFDLPTLSHKKTRKSFQKIKSTIMYSCQERF